MTSSEEPSVTLLIQSVNKFNGWSYLRWKRKTKTVVSLTHSGISDILNGEECPTETHEKVCGRSNSRRSPVVTRAEGKVVSTEEGTESSSGWNVNNENWIALYDRSDEELFNVLHLATAGLAAIFWGVNNRVLQPLTVQMLGVVL